MAEATRPDAAVTGAAAVGAGPAAGAPAQVARPAPVTGNGFIFVLSGPSGAGKGTLLAYLFQHRPDCVFSVSATTRPRRVSEAEGREYLFLARDEFERRRAAGEFLEWAEVHGNLYGTPVSEVDARLREGKVVVLDVDVQGGASMRRVRPDAVSVFIYPPSLDALHQRLLSRGTDSPEVIAERLGNAPGEIAQWKHYDYVIMNDRLDLAQQQLLAIHDAEYARPHRKRFS